MSHYHDCQYSCAQSCCNYFGRCPEDYFNTAFANEKRYTECANEASPLSFNNTVFLDSSFLYVAIIAIVILLTIIPLINFCRYMMRFLKKGN